MPKGFLSLQKIEVVRWPVRMSESAVPHVLYSDEMRRGQGAIRNPLSLEAMAIRERRGDGGCGSEVAVARRETRRSDDCSDPKAKNKNATKDTKLAKKKKRWDSNVLFYTHKRAATASCGGRGEGSDENGMRRRRREGGVGGAWGDKVVEEGGARRAQAPTGRER